MMVVLRQDVMPSLVFAVVVTLSVAGFYFTGTDDDDKSVDPGHHKSLISAYSLMALLLHFDPFPHTNNILVFILYFNRLMLSLSF